MTSDLLPFERGDDVGTSPWIVVTQAMIDEFGRSTNDPDPMHDDPEWAARHSPFGGTIAYGFLTVSLMTHLLYKALGVGGADEKPSPEDHGVFLNYGIEHLRLIAPVPAGSRVRGRFSCQDKKRDPKGRTLVTFRCTVEVEGASRPAMVGDWLTMWVHPREPVRV